MKLLFSLLILAHSAQTWAGPSCALPSKTNGLKEICDRLEPKCIEVGNHFKGPEKAVDVIKDLTAESSEDELFTRLIFAESLASTCVPGKNEQDIMEGIAWTLKNRVSANRPKIYGSGRNVVTHPGQFSSSTGPCDVAKRKEFLCPQKLGPNWHKTWEKASEAWASTKKSNNKFSNVRHYFFPTHFDNSKQPNCAKWKGVYPSWAKKESAVKDIPNCATFYNIKE